MYNTKQLGLECCYAALNQSSVTAKRLAQPSMTTSIFSDGRSSLLLLLLA